MTYYMAVCVETRYGRAGIVVQGESASKVVNFADSIPNRIGYVGGDSFAVAVKRAGMMERNEAGAWGPIAEASDGPAVAEECDACARDSQEPR